MILITGQDPWQRLYDAAEVSYYVLGGEANISVGGTASRSGRWAR
jgi:hypothetical protein